MADIREGSSSTLSFALKQNDGSPFVAANVLTLTLKLYDVESLGVIGAWNDLDVKNVNGGVLNTDGTGTVDIPGADNDVVGSLEINELEIHAALLKFTGTGGFAGSDEIRFNIVKIG